MIKLQIVDEATFEAVIGLEVAESDQRRVASNLYSLAEAWLYREKDTVFPYAIMLGKKVVGFLLLAKEKDGYFIWRLMIDQSLQRRGYGKDALRVVMRMAEQDASCHCIRAHYVIGNHRMRGLLESLGFRTEGLENNEIKMRIDIK